MPAPSPSPRELVGLGTTMAGLIVVGLVVGWIIDVKAHTLPLFVFVGLALGIGIASRYIYVKFQKYMKD